MLLRALLNLCWKLVYYFTCKCFTCGIYDLSWYRGLVLPLSKIPRHTSLCWELIRTWATNDCPWKTKNKFSTNDCWESFEALTVVSGRPGWLYQPAVAREGMCFGLFAMTQLGLGRCLETTKTTDTQKIPKFKHLPSESRQIHLCCLSFALCLMIIHFLILPIILLWKPCVFPKK